MAIISYTNVILEKDGIQVTIGMLPTDEVIVSKTYTAITYPKSTTAQSRKPADPEYGANTTLVFDIVITLSAVVTLPFKVPCSWEIPKATTDKPEYFLTLIVSPSEKLLVERTLTFPSGERDWLLTFTFEAVYAYAVAIYITLF